MKASSLLRKDTVLIADDFVAFRWFVRLKLQEQGFQTVVEASDGLEAVAKAADLQPDLVLLDIAMPALNGIDAAVQIHSVAPQSKILVVSENRSPDIAAEVLETGAAGYVVKSDAASELLPAIKAVLEGKRFLSAWQVTSS